MGHANYFLAFAFLFAQVVRADNTVVVGHVVSIEWAHVDIECPADSICLDAWTRWKISVDRTISGPPVKQRLLLAHLQHQIGHLSRNETILFVLTPIDDEKQKAKLHASFYISDLSLTRQFRCLNNPPTEIRFHVDADKVYTNIPKSEFCFNLDDAGPW
jgi:hypothetical protein